MKNLKHKGIEDGQIFIIDLAGSENAADSQFHDKTRVKETQAINKSLMALKDCIRNRALSAMNLDKYYHVPYRLSKLTLLLKDAFELESKRLCKTVVIANIAPTVADVSMSLNTLRYVSPLKIGQRVEKKAPNMENPANWNNEKLRDWVKWKTESKMDLELFCPYESGMQILRIPEAEFVERVLKSCPNWTEKRAITFYKGLWGLLIDARTKDRKERMRLKKGGTLKERMKEHDEYVASVYGKDMEKKSDKIYVRIMEKSDKNKENATQKPFSQMDNEELKKTLFS